MDSASMGLRKRACFTKLASQIVMPSIYFEHDDALKVETANLFFGGSNCPGISTAGGAGIRDFDPEELLTCVHECHQLKQ
jgi:hypothetical protein